MTNNDSGAQNDIRDRFRAQLAMKSQRQLAYDLGVPQSIVNRNATRLRRGLRITRTFAMQLEAALK